MRPLATNFVVAYTRGLDHAATTRAHRKIARWTADRGHHIVAAHEDIDRGRPADVEQREGLLAAVAAVVDSDVSALVVCSLDAIAVDERTLAIVVRALDRSRHAQLLVLDGSELARSTRNLVDLIEASERARERLRQVRGHTPPIRWARQAGAPEPTPAPSKAITARNVGRVLDADRERMIVVRDDVEPTDLGNGVRHLGKLARTE